MDLTKDEKKRKKRDMKQMQMKPKAIITDTHNKSQHFFTFMLNVVIFVL